MDIIGIGTDIEEVRRIKDIFLGGSRRSLERVFNTTEIDYCMNKGDPSIHLAGKFAAKEALIKSLGLAREDGFHLREIRILNRDGGPPYYSLEGITKEKLEEVGGTDIMLSISHTKDHAIAFAICIR